MHCDCFKKNFKDLIFVDDKLLAKHPQKLYVYGILHGILPVSRNTRQLSVWQP